MKETIILTVVGLQIDIIAHICKPKAMNDVFYKRLKSARILAGLCQDQLVLRMNKLVSKNAISKYEKGLMLPDSKVLLELAKTLNVKSDYFFRTYSSQEFPNYRAVKSRC